MASNINQCFNAANVTFKAGFLKEDAFLVYNKFSGIISSRGHKFFTQNHEYVDITDNKAKVGITDHAQKELGDVVYVDLPELDGQSMLAGDVACSVESVKAVAEVYMPISGTLLEVNEKLIASPGLVNDSPYDDGWLIEVEVTEPEQLDSLMDEKAYESYLMSTD